MRRFVKYLQKYSESYHFFIHLVLGYTCGWYVSHVFPDSPQYVVILLGILGGVFPDADHLLYIFWYGRRSEYAKSVKTMLRKLRLMSIYNFIRQDHKKLTGIYSHNFISLFIVLLIYKEIGLDRDRAFLASFFLSWGIHYCFDIAEDFLFFKTVNPNWYLKFNKHRK